LLLTLPVGLCSCEAVELSFSCLRRLKTWSKGGRRVCGKGTTFTVLWTNQTMSLCLLCFATLAAMKAVCEIFNLLHFRSMAQGGAWPKWPNGKYASARVRREFRTCSCGASKSDFRTSRQRFGKELTFLCENHVNSLQKHQPSQYAHHDDCMRQIHNKSSKMLLFLVRNSTTLHKIPSKQMTFTSSASCKKVNLIHETPTRLLVHWPT